MAEAEGLDSHTQPPVQTQTEVEVEDDNPTTPTSSSPIDQSPSHELEGSADTSVDDNNPIHDHDDSKPDSTIDDTR